MTAEPTVPAQDTMSEINYLACRDCGHVHSGPQLGYICVGCPCRWSPGAEPDPDDLIASVTAVPAQDTAVIPPLTRYFVQYYDKTLGWHGAIGALSETDGHRRAAAHAAMHGIKTRLVREHTTYDVVDSRGSDD